MKFSPMEARCIGETKPIVACHVSAAIRREISVAGRRHISPTIHREISVMVYRPVTIDCDIASRSNLGIGRNVSLSRRADAGVLIRCRC